MKKPLLAGAALCAVLVALCALYLNGEASFERAFAQAPTGPVLYWRDPEGKPAYSAVPAKAGNGRDYLPVHDSEEPGFSAAAPKAGTGSAQMAGPRKIKFYRNPMGLPDTSPVPKKDSMGMDYIPVYEDEAAHDGTVTLSPVKIQRAGVRTEAAQLRHLVHPVHAPAVAVIDERTMHDVTLRADSFIEKLYVSETGKHVVAGEPLFRAYTPDIVRAEVDFRSAVPGRGGSDNLGGAIQRLQNLDVPEYVIDDLKSGKAPLPTKIDWPAPVSGVVMEKKVIEGQKVNAGDLLYRIADLSKIWVIADIAEQDIGAVKIGAPAEIIFRAYPNEVFRAPVTFILHELEMATRTAKVRIELPNPDHRILHDMFAEVTIDAGSNDAPRLSVPQSAVLDTGDRQLVLVDKGEGKFEPRQVSLGARGDGFVEIKNGLSAGENVVTSANFLINSESNLTAALKSFSSPPPQKQADQGTSPGAASP